MIDVAVIASTSHLTDLSSAGSIDMALTHLVLSHPRQASYFAQRAAAGVTVILDNSAYELEATIGQGLDAGAVIAAADLIDPRIVICQDQLYDGPGTIASTRRFLAQAADTTDPGRFTFMAVAQGTTRREWLHCFHHLRDLPGIDVIGLSKLSVPRCFDAPVAEARLACLDHLRTTPDPLPPLHLLGGDRSLIWELQQHRTRGNDTWITSNDSSFAFWYAHHNLPADPATGRALSPAPGKPVLDHHILEPDRQALAHRHVGMLRAAAGLPPAAPAASATPGTSEGEPAWH